MSERPERASDDPMVVFWKHTLEMNEEATRKLSELKQHLTTLHERAEVLHEREEDYSVRLHNSYFASAEATNRAKGLADELDREKTRRGEERRRLMSVVERIRSERDTYRTEAQKLRKELKEMREKDSDMTYIWADAKAKKIEELALRSDIVSPIDQRPVAESDAQEQQQQVHHTPVLRVHRARRPLHQIDAENLDNTDSLLNQAMPSQVNETARV